MREFPISTSVTSYLLSFFLSEYLSWPYKAEEPQDGRMRVSTLPTQVSDKDAFQKRGDKGSKPPRPRKKLNFCPGLVFYPLMKKVTHCIPVSWLY